MPGGGSLAPAPRVSPRRESRARQGGRAVGGRGVSEGVTPEHPAGREEPGHSARTGLRCPSPRLPFRPGGDSPAGSLLRAAGARRAGRAGEQSPQRETSPPARTNDPDQSGRSTRDSEQPARTGLIRRPVPPALPRLPARASPAPPPQRPAAALTILLRAALGLGADSGSPRAGQLLLVVRRRRWRGLSPSIGAELGSSGGLGGEKPGEDSAPEAKGRAGRRGRHCFDSAPGPSAGGGLGPAALSHNCATRPRTSAAVPRQRAPPPGGGGRRAGAELPAAVPPAARCAPATVRAVSSSASSEGRGTGEP